MIFTHSQLEAIRRGRNKIKKAYEKDVIPELRKDSAWLEAVNDIIDDTALAIQNELEKIE